jgi:hypothetical protein
MITIRTYSNPAEAAIAKSLLDNHDIFCRLADEKANLYGGGPMAMPIRLLVIAVSGWLVLSRLNQDSLDYHTRNVLKNITPWAVQIPVF